MSNVYGYDTTAANNTTVGGQDVSEGVMPVNKINDAMRGVASELAKFRNDIGAKNTTTGTANAQALTTSSVITALADGLPIVFIAGATNTGSMTLNVDSLGAKAVKIYSGGSIVNVEGGAVQTGNIYTVYYSTAQTAWILQSAADQGGYILDQQVFTSSGTWTHPSNIKGTFVHIEVAGGGGGGGEALAAASECEGGEGGDFAVLTLDRNQLYENLTVTIGAGGTGATASTGGGGGAGGSTEVYGSATGDLIGAKGGDGGSGSVGAGSAATAWTRTGFYAVPLAEEFTEEGTDEGAPYANGGDGIYGGAAGGGGRNTNPSSTTGGDWLYFFGKSGGDFDYTTGPTAGGTGCGGAGGRSGQGGGAGGGGYCRITIIG